MIDLMPGLVFGLTDNGLLIFGAATGIGIERYFKKGCSSDLVVKYCIKKH